MRRCADRLAAITFSFRFSSSCRLTWSRTAASGAHRSSSAASFRHPRSSFGNSAMCTDASRSPGNMPPQLVHRHRQDRREQARQAVDDDVHRRLARAARLDLAPKVYIRSFVTSM